MKIFWEKKDGKLPEGCFGCKFRTDGASCIFVNEDYEVDYDHLHERPNWCPLVLLKDNEKVGIFRFMGKGKIQPRSYDYYID